jgi:hypothetical protein
MMEEFQWSPLPSFRRPTFTEDDEPGEREREQELLPKRPRADSLDSESGPVRKAQRSNTADGRPKARDFDLEVKDLLSAAVLRYRAELSTIGSYPDPAVEATFAKASWKHACIQKDLKIAYTPEVLGLVSL